MPLTSVISVELRSGNRRRYLNLVHELAEQARSSHDPLQWTTHETQVGPTNRIHFVSNSADFAELDKRGTADEMVGRVLGEKRALEWLDEFDSCTEKQTQELSVDRPDLSYLSSEMSTTAPVAVVTILQARPGHQEGCEELIRKIAEAIPKVGDGSQIVTFQTVIGDLLRYWTVRPLASLSDLDAQVPPAQLLIDAFGAAEGGLIFRSGVDAVASVERNIVVYRPELSNID
jgi:hypothetical protein